MRRLIRDGAVVDDPWTLVREITPVLALPQGVPVIVPFPLWRERRAALAARGDAGVWLAPHEDPALLAADVERLPVVAVDFPQFTDGRGYSIARLLRERHRFAGELRAIGDVQRDQLYALAQCGFDAFEIRADRDPHAALAGLVDLAGVYAPTAASPLPRFRRRFASAVGA